VHHYLNKLWRTKSIYIIGLLCLIGFLVLKYLVAWKLPSQSDIGFTSGLVSAVILLLGPIVYVDVKNIKIKKIRPIFVEPPMKLMVPGILLGWVLSFLLYILLASFNEQEANFVQTQSDANTLIGNLIMSFIIFASLLTPVTIYMLFIKLRYKKVVEYGSPKWKKIRKEKRV